MGKFKKNIIGGFKKKDVLKFFDEKAAEYTQKNMELQERIDILTEQLKSQVSGVRCQVSVGDGFSVPSSETNNTDELEALKTENEVLNQLLRDMLTDFNKMKHKLSVLSAENEKLKNQ